MPLPSSVLILHNLPREGGGYREADAGVLHEVAAVAEALRALSLPHRVAGVRRLSDVPAALAGGREPAVFNLVEALDGDPFDSMLVPAVCQALGRAVTGGDAVCQVVGLDKWQTKAALAAAGVRTPWAVVVPPGGDPATIRPPCDRVIVKPLSCDASEGIHADSVMNSADAPPLAAAVRRVHERFGHGALVEEYVEGREVNVSLVDLPEGLRALPIAEIDFSAFPAGRPRIVDYAAKWIEDSFEYRNTTRIVPACFDAATARRIEDAARAAWQCLRCTDYARVDMRVDEAGVPTVLEVNANPDLSPDAGFAAALNASGLAWPAFVSAVLVNAMDRHARRAAVADAASVPSGWEAAQPPAPLATKSGAFTVRWSLPRDRDALLAMVASTGVFHAYEMSIAEEVLDDALKHGPTGHYQSYTAVAESDGSPAGWVCFGPTPCTAGTFDMYWLAVAPAMHRYGIGRGLVLLCEAQIAARGGKRIVIETSSRAAYDGTRSFYLRAGYGEAARVRDFYGDGDDKVIYVKNV